MNLLINFCIISYLLVITIAIAMEKPSFENSKEYTAPLTKWKVTLTNQLSRGQTSLIHCKSKDDDLGDQMLQVGQSFSWKFKVNLLSTTLFWRNLRTSLKKHVSMEVFWPEKHDWLDYRCTYETCNWDARDNSIYLENRIKNVDVFVRTWEN